MDDNRFHRSFTSRPVGTEAANEPTPITDGESDRIVDTTNAELAVMQGRPMQGWLRVAPEHLRTKRQVATWVQLGAAYAQSLPSK